MQFFEDENNGLGQSSWAALEDIDARASAAYKRHQVFFDNPAHTKMCSMVETILRDNSKLWKNVFQTCRASTSVQEVHTQVKLDKVEFHKGGFDAAKIALQDIGVDATDINYRGRTMSISVRVK